MADRRGRGRRTVASAEALRAAVQAYVDAHGYRRTAEETGVSVGGLSGYLEGARPYARTLRKLEAWYARTAAKRAGELTAEMAQLVIELLVRDVPEAHRADFLVGILEDLRKRWEAAGLPPPAWLRELME